MELLEASVRQLRVNPAQMRTRTKVEDLAQLVLQVQAGIDRALRLLVQPQKDGTLRVISGHRRWLAAMIAAVADKSSLEGIMSVIQIHCQPENGWVRLTPELYTRSVEMAPEVVVPIEIWDGTAQDEILTLLRANMGAEKPDLKGVSHAFNEALNRGVSIEALAQTAGMPVPMVQAIIDIPNLPAVFQDLLFNGQMDLSLVPRLLGLGEHQLAGLSNALERIAHDDRESHYSSRIDLAINQLCFEPQPANRKETNPVEHNKALLICRLRKMALEEDPESFYHAVASKGLSHLRTDHPSGQMAVLSEVPSVTAYLGEQSPYGGGRHLLTHVALDLFPEEAGCSNCIFGQLPKELLLYDLQIPCREGRKRQFPEEKRCIHWSPPDQPFCFTTPWVWENGGKAVRSAKALLKAWHHQKDHEAKRPPSAVSTGQKDDIAIQRAVIQGFIDRHTSAPFVDHPWATSCSRCQHRCEKSPVKAAPDAPLCQWSKGRHAITMEAYVPSEKGIIRPESNKMMPVTSPTLDENDDGWMVPFEKWPDVADLEIPWMIPSCRQFQPIEKWSELVPETEGAMYPREVMEEILLKLADQCNNNVYSPHERGALQFLTGRPLAASANHRKTFHSAFKKQRETLTDGQIWTLVRWLLLEWVKVRSHMSGVHVPIGPVATVQCSLIPFSAALGLLEKE